jgi:AcrR family transcriptional regulator
MGCIVKEGSSSKGRGIWLARNWRAFDAPYGGVLTNPAHTSTIRHRMAKDLGRNEWLRAARVVLLKLGVSEVRVERLARDLRVTKGSFYWHFKDREDLLESLVQDWEVDFPQIISKVKGKHGREALRLLLRLTVAQAPLSEAGIVPSDAAMFTWASTSAAVAGRVNRTEKKRIELLERLIGDSERTEIMYLVWLGFVARGQRVPASRKRFPQIARTMLQLFLPTMKVRKRRTHKQSKRKTSGR